MLMTRGYTKGSENCTVLRECSSCGIEFVSTTLIGCVATGVTPICDQCREAAEAVAGEDDLTELLAEGELNLYVETICEINRILAGEWTGAWN